MRSASWAHGGGGQGDEIDGAGWDTEGVRAREKPSELGCLASDTDAATVR